MSGAHPFLSQHNEEERRAYLRSQEIPGPDIERIFSSYHVEDSPLDLPSHLRLLREAGFGVADVAWKRANFAVYVALKEP